MTNILKSLIALTFVLFLSLPDAQARFSPPENCPEIPFGKGRLWKVTSPQGISSYVFGTVHTANPKVLQIPGIIMEAFNRSHTIVLELSTGDQLVFDAAAAMFGGPGYSLQRTIPAPLFKTSVQYIKKYGIPPELLDNLKIWAVAITLSLPPEKRQNKGPLTFLDKELEKLGKKLGKGIFPLEKPAEQLGLFDTLPLSVQTEYLQQVVKDHPNVEEQIAELTQFYLSGNTGWIYCKVENDLQGTSEAFKSFMREDLLNIRNAKMVDRSLPKLSKGGLFIAVGALHLPGKKGILSLLKNKGYRISKEY